MHHFGLPLNLLSIHIPLAALLIWNEIETYPCSGWGILGHLVISLGEVKTLYQGLGNLGLPLLLPQLSGFLCSKCPGFLSASWIPYILHWHRALAYPVSSFISSLWNQLDLGFLSLGTVLQWNGMCECPYHWGKEHTQYTEVWMACSIILWRISFDTEEDKIRNYGWISSHHSWNIKSIIILTSVYVSILLILFALYSIE